MHLFVDAGQYEKVIEIEERLITEFESNQQNLSEAQAVLASAYYKLGNRIATTRTRSVEQEIIEDGIFDSKEEAKGYKDYVSHEPSLKTVHEIDNVVDKDMFIVGPWTLVL